MDILAVICSIISIIIAVLAFQANQKTSIQVTTLLSERASLHNAEVELQIRLMITAARERLENISLEISSKDCDNSKYSKIFESALENVSNAYDEACTKYLDDKTDKERFKKTYFNELKNWVEGETTQEKYKGPQTKFKATVMVYEEWTNLEK